MVSEKPDVQPHAIAQAEAERVASADKDKDGQAFNAAIHAVNADGSPRKTVSGRWALKRGNKGKPGATAQPASAVKSGVVVPGATPQTSAKEQESRAAGVGAANMLMALAVGLGGMEWQPRADPQTGMNEKAMLESAFAEYFASKQWADLPPGLALTAAICMYALPRFAMPQTRSRFQKFKEWCGAKIGAWKMHRLAKRRGMPVTDAERGAGNNERH